MFTKFSDILNRKWLYCMINYNHFSCLITSLFQISQRKVVMYFCILDTSISKRPISCQKRKVSVKQNNGIPIWKLAFGSIVNLFQYSFKNGFVISCQVFSENIMKEKFSIHFLLIHLFIFFFSHFPLFPSLSSFVNDVIIVVDYEFWICEIQQNSRSKSETN